MTAVATASVQTGLRPAIRSLGASGSTPLAQGPSPPRLDSTPSMIAKSIGRAPSRSAVTRGTRHFHLSLPACLRVSGVGVRLLGADSPGTPAGTSRLAL